MNKLFFVLAALPFALAVEEQFQHHEHPSGDENYAFDREVFLGSRQLANDLMEMTEDEARDKVMAVATGMDLDGDGTISLDELTQALKANFLRLDQEESEDKLKEWDTNNDNFIDWNEYVAATYQTEPEKLEELAQSETLKTDPNAKSTVTAYLGDKFRFNLADVNQDGKLDLTELTAFLHPYDFEHMIPSEVKQTRESYDIDEDGKISLDEFTRSDSSGSSPEWKEVEEQRFKNELDLNKDGYLDDDELKAWIAPSLQSAAGDEAKHLMSIADADQSQTLSQDEISDIVPTLVGANHSEDDDDDYEGHDEL